MIATVRPPADFRQLLMLFVLYDKQRGLASILDRLDLRDVTRRQVYLAALNRLPESGGVAVDGPGYSPRAHLEDTLAGREFQHRIRELILEALPEKQRLIFVHIPKCAGTDLIETLRLLHPWVHFHLSQPAHADTRTLFAELHDIALKSTLTDAVAVTGHVPLQWYIDRQLIRFRDALFTTVRDPVAIMYSYVNFILSRLVRFRGERRGDTDEWLGYLGLKELPENASDSYLRELGSQILRHPDITSRDMICRFLGRDGATVESAVENIVITDIEITDVQRYSAWRRARFGVEPDRPVNVSEMRPLTDETISARDRQFIADATAQDRLLYARVMQALQKGGALSIRGHELA